jgi:hypothetical protein
VGSRRNLLNDIEANKKGNSVDGLIYHASYEGENIFFDVPIKPLKHQDTVGETKTGSAA